MRGDSFLCRSNSGLWRRLYPIFLCAACIPQTVTAASLNQNDICTVTSTINSHNQTDCQDSNKHSGNQDTIVVSKDEVINVVASDSDKTVIAIEGGHHDDTIINHGKIYLQVTNTGKMVPVWYDDYSNSSHAEVGYKSSGISKASIVKPTYWLLDLNDISIDAIGISGGYGNDFIKNFGLLDVSTITTLTNEAGSSHTYSIGIAGNNGKDELVNEGQLNVVSDAVATVDHTTFSLLHNGDAQRQAMAIAAGITGDAGEDDITNKGQLTVTANAEVDTADFNVALVGGPIDVDAGSEARAGAIGLDGGEGHDQIYNQGTVTVSANALAASDNVSIDLINISGGKSVRAPLSANAMAIGIVGDEGNDAIYNSGNLNVTADAKADALDVQVTGLSLSAGGANTTSEAIALGMHGGKGEDDIYNDGDITVNAKATTNTDNVNVTFFDLSFIPPLFGFDNEQVATTASSEAAGIIGGDGNDKVRNTGSLLVQSDATVDIDGLSISLLGLGSEVNRTATAAVTGISGEHGNDYIKNSGQLDARSNAKLDLLNIGVDLVGGATNIDASNQALASAMGIDGGDGHDHIRNLGSTNVTAKASVNSVDVGISLLSALQGDDIRAPIHVDADASGILGGEGHDVIENTGSLSVTADARADALDMEISAVDISSGGMSTTSEASAMGIDDGKGKSQIHNSGDITVKSTATTDTESFAFTLVDLSIVSDIVDLVFDTPIDTSTTAKADGTGIRTGDDHDVISNHGSLSVSVDAITNTFEMSMSADGVSNFTELSSFPDFFLAEPVVDASTTAEASVMGIDSGHGNDVIYNVGTLFAKAKADVTANSIGVDLPLPDLLPQILPNIDTTEVATAAKAGAMGISTGEGHDTVQNDGSVWSEAIANANSLSVNVTLDVPIIPDPVDYNIPYSIEANLVDVGAQSEAEAVGIETGKGHDHIYSIGDVTAKAITNSNATNIAATVAYSDDKVSFGLSLANASTEGKATVLGISSGSGDDVVYTTGNVLADAFVDTNSTAVTVDLQAQKDTIVGIGASATRANSEAETNSIGITLGEGNDKAHNEGSITARAHNNVDAVAVDVGVTIPVGDNFGIIGEGNWVSTDTIATSSTDGILGGDGRDHVFNAGTINADAFSDPNSVGVTANASGTKKGASIGIALTQAKTEGVATSNGIRGGKDKDRLTNTGTINSTAKTDADAVSVAVSLTLTDKGVALTGTAADGSSNASSTANGMAGDEAEDVIHNEGTVDVLADADAETVSVSVAASGASKGVALGLALSRATSEANANSEGISGGSHDDQLYSSGLVKSHAKANVLAGSGGLAVGGTGKGLTVEGAAADGSTTGNATATGITGDQGEDHIVNEGMVDVLADVDATSVSVGVSANGTGTGATIGIALGRATSKAEADSRGISGGSDSDSIANSGSVKSHAMTTTIAGSGALAAGGAGKGLTVEGAGVDAATNAGSTAKGISGDEGYVHIFNQGDVDVLADADATSVSVAVSANGTGTGVTFGLGLARATSAAEADSTGLAGDKYGDGIYNHGPVKSHALSTVIAGSGALAAGGSGKGLTIEGAGADGSTKGTSTSVGINAKEGDDHIVNKGTVDVLADADATSISVSATAFGTGTGAAIGVAVARARSDAEADSIGINGGAGHDGIFSSGMVKSHAKSNVIAGSGALSAGGSGTGVTATLAGADAATKSISTAKAINGGEGHDHIFSEDIIDVLADASATSVSVSVAGNFTGTGVSFGLGLARATSEAEADSAGLAGGAGHDDIFSSALVKSHAKTEVIAGSGGLAGGGAGTGLSVQGAGADAGTNAASTTSGLSGDAGDDHIFSEGMVDVLADARATSVSVSATANGAGTGVTLGIGLARATSEAEANSSGISGGTGTDEIASWEKVKSHAKSRVLAGSGALAGGGAGTGLTIQGAAADGISKGLSTALGITGDEGDDILQSEAELDVYAEANTTSVSVAVSANGTGTGVSAGVALARAASEGEANSIGISGGDNNDNITNIKLLKAHAKSDVDAVSVSAAMGGTGTGVAIQGAAADAATVSHANATGISGGADIDKIYNEGTLDVMADADATSVSVGLSVSGTGAGVGLGISVARAGTEAISKATGISLGAAEEAKDDDRKPHKKRHKKDDSNGYAKTQYKNIHGDDKPSKDKSCNKGDKQHADKSCNNDHGDKEEIEYVENHGNITATSLADADSVSVSAQLGISGAGLQAGGAIVDASTKATATAQGIEGSQHKDIIINHDSIEANTDADATTTAVAVSLNADIKGATLSVAVTDATAMATAQSIGIAGLTGDDKISNQGAVTAKAKAETDAISVSIPIGIAFVPLSVGFADSTATASADVYGLDGGDGNDYLESAGSILADAESDAFGISVSVAPIGVSLASANINADATATGMAGAGGDDVIHQTETASLTATSNAAASGTVISATLLGAAGTIFDDNESAANSQSTGISGGEGNDETVVSGSIFTDASSTATGVSVSAAYTGATFANTTTRATTYSTGISGGEDYDHIINFGSIHAKGSSTTSGTGVSVAINGATFADTSSTSTTHSTGISGDGQDDHVKNIGSIHAEGSATASGTSVSAAINGATFADTNTSATMYSTGILGGDGNDHIKNTGSIHAEGSAAASGTTVSAAFTGATFADTNTSATMHSTGISGGTGYDYIENHDSVVAEANSNATGTTVSAALIGAAFADLSSVSNSSATGIDTGADKDKLINKGAISVDAVATADGTSIAAGLVGYFDADASTTVGANAMGIELGSGDDYAFTEGNLDITARSNSTVTAGSGTLAGAASATANITSTVDARGISGGSGNDLIINKGVITIGPASESDPWMSRLTSTSFTFTLAGAAIAESAMYSATRSTGLDGGVGDDRIHNTGDLNISATSYSASTSTAIAIFGSASGGGTSGAITEAVGISGGDGLDEISNKARIDVNSTSNASLSAVTFTFAGASSANNKLTATTNAWGIASGNDMDIIWTEDVIDVDVVATLTSSSNARAIFGSANAGATLGAELTAFGIDSGTGNDFIHSLSLIDVASRATVNLNASSYTFGGTSGSGGTLAAQANVAGIFGGLGDDHIESKAAIQVAATSTMNSSSNSNATFGAAASSVTSGSNTTVMGIDGGEGDDYIANRASINVFSRGEGDVKSTSFSFAGGTESDAAMTARSDAKGINGGTGSDKVTNKGNVTVTVDAELTASGGTRSTFGSGNVGATVSANANASGIEASGGDNQINNENIITVNATAKASSDNNADAGIFFAGSTTRSRAQVQGSGFGIKVDGTSGTVWNDGSINVTQSGTASSTSSSDGDTLAAYFGIDVDASSASTSTVSATHVYGIWGGHGENDIFNKGSINIIAQPHAYAWSSADGDGLDGDGTARATATANGVRAIGISLGNANNYVLNEGSTSASSRPSANAYSEADADEQGDMDPNTIARANDAKAVAVWAGHGHNQIINTGTLSATSAPNVNRARAYSDGGTALGNVDGDSDATASATGSLSTGIETGNGDNWLLNQGTITAASTPRTIADAYADGDGADGDGHADADADTTGYAHGINSGHGANWITNETGAVINASVNAYANAIAEADGDAGGDATARTNAHAGAVAYGIVAGNGDNYIVNNGTINVSAVATATTSNTTSAPWPGAESNPSSRTSIARAFGIYTGSGDDIIFNHGTITTSVSATGGTRTTQREAIHSGAGDDTVTLTDGSSVTGDIDLGADNDILNLVGSPTVNGAIRGAEGTNILAFKGAGTFEFTNPASDFHTATKTGEGTYTLSSLAPMQSIEVKQGVLEINSDYEFAAGSSFMPSISSGDGKGKLVINGAVNFSAAAINVMKGRGHHLDGEKQTVLYASAGILNSMSFNNIKMPEKTPLLEFHHEITTDEVKVITAVKPFNTVASSNNQRSIANYMDGLLAHAEGNVSEALGEIQAMKAGGHSSAFSSVNPEPYVNTQQALEAGVKNYTSTLLQRTRGLRNSKQYNAFVQPGFMSSEQGELLYKNQSTDSLSEILNLSSRAYRPYGAWVKTYWQDGQLDQTAANAGFDFDSNGYAIGFDKWLDQKRVIGISMGMNETKLTADNNRSRSDIDSQLFSLYSSYVTNTGFIDGSLSYGYNSYTTQRDATIGLINNTVLSEHNGDVYGASLAAGLFFLVNTWDLETYGVLQYQQQDEDGFQETGTGGISLSVAPRKSDLLSSEVGFRFGKQFKKRSSSIFTEFGIAWLHEFKDDSSIEASFVDSPNSSFTVDAQDIDNDGVLLNFGLSYTNKKGFTGTAEYRSDIRDGYTDQTVFANIQYLFD